MDLGKRSCRTNLTFNDLFSFHNKIKSLNIIYLEFEDALYKTPLGKLMYYVRPKGITTRANEWLNSLSNISQWLS